MRRQIILASQSPRRRELLAMCQIPFADVYPNCKETMNKKVSPEEAIMAISAMKAESVFAQYPQAVVIGADTVVSLKGKIMGKPKDEEDAIQMLQKLSGKTHQVITGVTILSQEESTTFHSVTDVEFYKLTEQEILDYVKTKEPLDKAGAYGIQGRGCTLVKEIKGDFYTVVGLPIAAVVKIIQKYL